VPVPASGGVVKEKVVDEEKLLKTLAEDYRVNPGLYMTREDITGVLDVGQDKLDELLVALEKRGLVKVIRTKKGMELAKATYDGLNQAHPLEYYRWFPEWINRGKDRIF